MENFGEMVVLPEAVDEVEVVCFECAFAVDHVVFKIPLIFLAVFED